MRAPQLRQSKAAGTQKHQRNPSGEWVTETGLPMGAQMRGDQHEALLYRLLVRDLQEYAIFQIDLDHKMASWNAGVERSLGYTEQEFLGLPFAQLFTEEDIAAKIPEQEIELAIKDGRSEDERWHVRKDGSVFLFMALWCRFTKTIFSLASRKSCATEQSSTRRRRHSSS